MTRGATPAVDPALRHFIESAFPSVWALETFLAVKRGRDGGWRVEDLVAELRANTVLVADCLDRLGRAGLVVGVDEIFVYKPASPGLAALADALQAAYAERPFSIIGVIAAQRPDPLKGFADSFRLGGWKS